MARLYRVDKHLFSKSKIYQGCSVSIIVTSKEIKEKIIQDFTEMIWQIDVNTSDEINNRLADITKRVRRLYASGRDD